MIPLPDAAGKDYGICGLGKSGRAMLAALTKSGANVWAWDDNETVVTAARKEFAAVQLLQPEEWPWSTLSVLLMSPGIPLYFPKTHPAVALAQQSNVQVIGDIELLYRAQGEAQFIGITGTNGKSTTTALIGHILAACGQRAEVGGNLGTPVLALSPLPADGTYVLELSSYQLELLDTAAMDIAVLLNISPDHLDHHGSMENYIAAKKHIFTRTGTAIVGADDAVSESICRELIAARHAKIIPISVRQKVQHGIFVQGGILHNTLGATVEKADINGIKSLTGEHNWQNAAAAYAACLTADCAHADIIRAMRTYPGLPHRMQWLGEVSGIQFVNDSKATNADAAEKALKSYDHIYWIAGGIAKEGGIGPLARYFSKIRQAYLIGEAAPAFAQTLAGRVKVSECGTLDKAFAQATADALRDGVKGAVVMLAPACASFDQFPNFEARGDAFAALFTAWRKQQGEAA